MLVVDHLLVFKGEGEIQDFPGNYTQYRDWSRLQEKDEAEKAAATAKNAGNNNTAVNDGAGTAKRDANFSFMMVLALTWKAVFKLQNACFVVTASMPCLMICPTTVLADNGKVLSWHPMPKVNGPTV